MYPNKFRVPSTEQTLPHLPVFGFALRFQNLLKLCRCQRRYFHFLSLQAHSLGPKIACIRMRVRLCRTCERVNVCVCADDVICNKRKIDGHALMQKRKFI